MGQINDVPFNYLGDLKIVNTDPFVTEKVSDIQLVDSQTKLVNSKTKLVDSKTKLVNSKTKLVDSKTKLVDSKTKLEDSNTKLVNSDDSKSVASATKLVRLATPLVNSATADKHQPVKASSPKPFEVKSTDASPATTKKEPSSVFPGPLSKTPQRNKTQVTIIYPTPISKSEKRTSLRSKLEAPDHLKRPVPASQPEREPIVQTPMRTPLYLSPVLRSPKREPEQSLYTDGPWSSNDFNGFTGKSGYMAQSDSNVVKTGQETPPCSKPCVAVTHAGISGYMGHPAMTQSSSETQCPAPIQKNTDGCFCCSPVSPNVPPHCRIEAGKCVLNSKIASEIGRYAHLTKKRFMHTRGKEPCRRVLNPRTCPAPPCLSPRPSPPMPCRPPCPVAIQTIPPVSRTPVVCNDQVQHSPPMMQSFTLAKSGKV